MAHDLDGILALERELLLQTAVRTLDAQNLRGYQSQSSALRAELIGYRSWWRERA